MNQKSLSIFLSKLGIFSKLDIKLEQYPTDSNIAAEILWSAALHSEIEGKTIADFGCGTGILGIGALVLGAKKVLFVDIDKNAISKAKENIFMAEKFTRKHLDAEFFNMDISGFLQKADLVIQNPPFGTRNEHIDKQFLLKAFETAPIVYSFHKLSTANFVEKVASDNGFKVERLFRFKFPLKKSFSFHVKEVEHIEVGCWKLVKE